MWDNIITTLYLALTSERFWQVILVLLTVYVTNLVSTIFQKRREKEIKTQDAIANIKKFGYLLEKSAYHRYEAEIFFNYYLAINRLNHSAVTFEEAKRISTNLMFLSNDMYKIYADLFHELSKLQQILNVVSIKGKASYR